MNIWNQRRAAGLLLLSVGALALGSCGGGGGSSSSAPPVALPTPAPTPAPTPTPAPSPTYLLATDLTADRDFPGWGVRLQTIYTAPPPGSPATVRGTNAYSAVIADETRAAGFTYVAAARTYTARWFADERSFGPATSSVFQGFLPIDSVGAEFFRGPFRISVAQQAYTQYLGGISWQIYTGNGNAALNSELREHFSVFGYPTQASDLPTSASGTYRLNPSSRQVGLPFDYTSGFEDVQLTINWQTGAVTGIWTAPVNADAPAGSPALSLTVTGQVNPGTSRMSGTISGQGFGGSFTGAVFGPRAQEIGFAYQINDGRGGFIVGTVGSVRS